VCATGLVDFHHEDFIRMPQGTDSISVHTRRLLEFLAARQGEFVWYEGEHPEIYALFSENYLEAAIEAGLIEIFRRQCLGRNRGLSAYAARMARARSETIVSLVENCGFVPQAAGISRLCDLAVGAC
jgi:hypothetical protein